ncbi:MAG TPA: PAS domain S-box protein, partial [Syntrophales bacterium]|nr:PAS domain S-box protein [Syntrophales bacterium]
RIMGYKEQHIIGKTSIELNIWDNIKDRQKLVAGLRRDGQVINLEAAFRTKSGDIRYGLMSATLIDLDGVPHVLSITRDITDRKEAEDALQKSEKQYRELIDGMTETVWIIDFDGNLIDVNKSALEILGYPKKELLNIGLYGIDSSLKKEDIKALARAMPSDKVQMFETLHRTKDGKVFPVEVSSSVVTYQGKQAIMSIARDISERKEAEKALFKSEEKFRTIFDKAGDGILIADAEEKKILQGNAAICSMLGYSENEITSLTIFDIHPPKAMPRILDEFEEQVRGKDALAEGMPVMRKDGSIFYADIAAAPTVIGGTDCLLGIFRDITERKLVEETVAKAAREWQSTFDAANDAIWILDSEHRVLQSNKTAERLFQIPHNEIIGKLCWEIVHDTTQPIPECPIIRAQQSLSRETMELRIDNRWFEVTADPILDEAGRFSGAVHVISDITERKQAEEALKESEKQYRLLADNASDVIFVLDMNLDYIYVSPSVKILRGYEPEEVFKEPASQTVTPSSWDLAMRTLSEVLELEKTEQKELVVSRTLELEMVRKDGTTVWTEVQFTLLRDENQLPSGILGVTRDIDDRKRGEEELQRSEAFLNRIIEESPSPMWISDKDGLLVRINPACCNLLNITPEEVIGKYNILRDNIVEEQGFLPLVKSVFEEGKTVRFDLEYQTSRLNQLTLQEEKSLILDITVFPIRGSNGNVVNAVIQHIDITDRKRAEGRLKETLDRLRKTVETNIQVMVSAVEAKDPYTAGHQIQVANLARAIAEEMKLPQEAIDGIGMAGSIHDIGKLSVPSEILSKPTRLLDIEYSLIKEHSLKGYEILKDVETDWPLAEIVYQHHERMDGSGYPRGLRGKEILMEARILAVADVVESMASHRPYRPSLGIEVALEEISKNRGILYDPEVTDACLSLFQDKGYSFK